MYVRTNNNITWIMIHIEFASKNCYIYCRWKSPRKVARNMRNGLMDTWKMERFGRALRLLTNKLLLRAEWVPQRADWLTGWLVGCSGDSPHFAADWKPPVGPMKWPCWPSGRCPSNQHSQTGFLATTLLLRHRRLSCSMFPFSFCLRLWVGHKQCSAFANRKRKRQQDK